MTFLWHGMIFLMYEVTEAILLAGGSGNRLQPFTHYTSKHLLPIDDVPMIFYPLKNLQLIGIKKVYLIVNENHLIQWESLLSKYDFKMEIITVIQDRPLGIPAAIQCCSGFIRGKSFIVALGDNVIIASNFLNNFKSYMKDELTATVCGFTVSDPKSFGVARFDDSERFIEVVEKPDIPPSSIAIAGFYKFPVNAFKLIESLEFSSRGELEIADLINIYINQDLCELVRSNSHSDYWVDTGSNNALVGATAFVRDLKRNSGLSIAQFSPKDI